MSENWLRDQNANRTDYNEPPKEPSLFTKTIRSRSAVGTLLIVSFAITVPVLIYYFVINAGAYDPPSDSTCSVNATYRIPCGPPNVTQAHCASISCCFDRPLNRCFHYLPSRYYYSKPADSEPYRSSQLQTPFGTDSVNDVQITYSELDANRVRIVLHSSKTTEEVTQLNGAKNYLLRQQYDRKLQVNLYRADNVSLLLTSAEGPLIVSEKYWEWSVQLTDEYLFGLGQPSINLEPNETLTRVIYANGDDHDTLPVFIAKRGTKFHGLIVRCDGLLEVTVLPSKLIVLKTLSESRIELEVATGESLKDVIAQQKNMDLVKNVPISALGVHVCREGNEWDVDEMVDEYNSFDSGGIDYVSDCVHSNLFFALQKSGRSFDQFSTSREFVLALPPQILKNSTFYTNVKDSVTVYQTSTGKDYDGVYLDEDVVYPNFESDTSETYGNLLKEEINSKFGRVPSQLLLYNNWPLDESFNETDMSGYPYVTEQITNALLYTLPWNTHANTTLHLTAHNNYANAQTLLLQRTTAAGRISTAGHAFDSPAALALQRVPPTWSGLRAAIRSMLYNGLFGYPLVAVPVCGSTADYDPLLHEPLCVRWYLVASTAPLFYVSSERPRRHPAALRSGYAAAVARRAIDIRASLAWYMHSVFRGGEPLARPLFYDFAHDNNSLVLTEEYMVGDALLVAHPLLPEKTQLKVYLPVEVGVWYEYWSGLQFRQSTTDGGWILLTIYESDWLGFIRGGKIIPQKIQAADPTTFFLKPILALDGSLKANGTVWIESAFFTMEATSTELVIKKEVHDSITSMIVLKEIIYYDEKEHFLLKCDPIDLVYSELEVIVHFVDCEKQSTFLVLA